MQLSLNWLAQHVDLEGLDPEEIARQLTLKTALIEGLRDQRAAIAGVVVGEVVTCRPHPGADRLRLCTVAFGGERPAAVVCGAPNVAAGQKVLFAPVGTSLPNGVKRFKLPDEFNYIKIYQQIAAEPKTGFAEAALNALAHSPLWNRSSSVSLMKSRNTSSASFTPMP